MLAPIRGIEMHRDSLVESGCFPTLVDEVSVEVSLHVYVDRFDFNFVISGIDL